MNDFYGLDWLIMIMNLYSYYLIGIKNRYGFIIGGLGCLIGVIMFGFLSPNYPMLLMNSSFGYLNIINYRKWKN